MTDQANSEAPSEAVDSEQVDAISPEEETDGAEQVVEEPIVVVDELTAAKNEADDMRDRWMRSVAELENFRKRTARDHRERVLRAAERVLLEVLTPVDNLARGLKSGKEAAAAEGLSEETSAQLQSFIEGMELVYNQFATALERENVKAMEPIGEPFDPNLHEALMVAENDEAAPNTVLDVVERGYWIGDRVLRHAKVVVSKAPSAASEEEE